MKTLMKIALSALVGAGMPGCVVHGHGEVLVPGVHVHDAHCGHYWRHGRWWYWSGHVHGPRCGHMYYGGRWCRDDGP